jgi:hypothetical protein
MSVQMPQTLSKGLVEINGMVTTREAAIAAGILSAEEPAPMHHQGALTATKAGSNLAIGEAQTQGANVGAAPAEVSRAGAILSQVAETHGPDQVNAALDAAARTGEVPARLPEGVTSDQVSAVVAGYTASAREALAPTGASISTLEEMLTQAELRDVRYAAIHGDQGWIEHLGREAMSRLETLPSRNEGRFKELLNTMSPSDRKAIEQRNSQWIVKLPPPLGEMPWGVAVRQGYLKF